MTNTKKLLEAIDEQEEIIEYVVENYSDTLLDILHDQFMEYIDTSDYMQDRD